MASTMWWVAVLFCKHTGQLMLDERRFIRVTLLVHVDVTRSPASRGCGLWSVQCAGLVAGPCGRCRLPL